jgi:hypothetical protein
LDIPIIVLDVDTFDKSRSNRLRLDGKKVNPVIMARVHRLRIDADDKTAIYTHNM